jgi:hypothetical protein
MHVGSGMVHNVRTDSSEAEQTAIDLSADAYRLVFQAHHAPLLRFAYLLGRERALLPN